MNKIKTVLIDDENDSIEVMQLLLGEHCPNIEIVAWANSVDDGHKIINEYKPHLVFLDVEMPGKNGFELLKEIDNPDFHVIMVTGYENYAIKAIKYSALDYILKPVDAEDLVNAVAKLNPQKMSKDPRLAHFNELIKEDKVAYDKLMISSLGGFKNITLNNIVYMESQAGNYCVFHLENGKSEVVTKSMSFFEKLLPDNKFHRIHRSHMINLSKVIKYESQTGEVVLVNDIQLTVSVRNRGEFKKKINA
jgi:two-component system LytT family response regulator